MIKKNLSLIFTASVLIWILVEIFIFVYQNWGPAKSTPLLTPTPLPTKQFTASPSAYATDAAILKMEKDLKNLENDLDAVYLDEPSLRPPILDLNIEY